MTPPVSLLAEAPIGAGSIVAVWPWAAPGWLWALGAILLPILLHLFSRGRSRRVLVGTVSWLRPARALRGRRLRPSDPGLLALRVAALAGVAVALAQPGCPARAPEARVVSLVDPAVAGLLDAGDAAARRAWREFVAGAPAGEHPRWLIDGFRPADLGAEPAPGAARRSLGAAADDAARLPEPHLGSLLLEADRAEEHPGTRLRVLAVPRAAWIAPRATAAWAVGDEGIELPVLRHAVAWFRLADPRPNRWIERATRQAGRWRILEGWSDGAGLRFARREEPVLEGTAVRAGAPLAPPDAWPLDDAPAAPPQETPLAIAWAPAPGTPLAMRRAAEAAIAAAAGALDLAWTWSDPGPAGGVTAAAPETPIDVLVLAGWGAPPAMTPPGGPSAESPDRVAAPSARRAPSPGSSEEALRLADTVARAGGVALWIESPGEARWVPCDRPIRWRGVGGNPTEVRSTRCLAAPVEPPPEHAPSRPAGAPDAHPDEAARRGGRDALARWAFAREAAAAGAGAVASGALLERRAVGEGSIWRARWPFAVAPPDRSWAEVWPATAAALIDEVARRRGRLVDSVRASSDRRALALDQIPAEAAGPPDGAPTGTRPAAGSGGVPRERASDRRLEAAAWALAVACLLGERWRARRDAPAGGVAR